MWCTFKHSIPDSKDHHVGIDPTLSWQLMFNRCRTEVLCYPGIYLVYLQYYRFHGWIGVPVSQAVPSYPASQVQAYPFTPSTHVAPFKQGSLAHSSVSTKCRIYIFFYHYAVCGFEMAIWMKIHNTPLQWRHMCARASQITTVNSTVCFTDCPDTFKFLIIGS